MLVLVGLVVVAAVAVTALSRAQWAALNRAAFSQPAPPASQPARRGKVFVRWSMGGGLCNQVRCVWGRLGGSVALTDCDRLLASRLVSPAPPCVTVALQLVSHINGLTISLAMGADAAILPHTKHRENFNHTRSTHKQGVDWAAWPARGDSHLLHRRPSHLPPHLDPHPTPPADGGQWKAAHIDTLLDLKTMRREWQARGLELDEVGGCLWWCYRARAHTRAPACTGRHPSSSPGDSLQQGPRSQAARARAPWRNCIVTGADAFAPPPGSKYLVADLATVLSRLRLALGDVWQEHGPKACVLVEAGNLFGALNTSRRVGRGGQQQWSHAAARLLGTACVSCRWLHLPPYPRRFPAQHRQPDSGSSSWPAV